MCPNDLSLTLTGNITNDVFQEAENSITSNEIIQNGNVIYRAGNSIELNLGFYTNASTTIFAYIHPCNINGNSSGLRIAQPNKENINNISLPQFTLFPNPTNGLFKIRDLIEAEQYKMVSIFDNKLNLIKRISFVKSELELDLTGLAKGLYLVKIQTDKSTTQLKLILI